MWRAPRGCTRARSCCVRLSVLTLRPALDAVEAVRQLVLAPRLVQRCSASHAFAAFLSSAALAQTALVPPSVASFATLHGTSAPICARRCCLPTLLVRPTLFEHFLREGIQHVFALAVACSLGGFPGPSPARGGPKCALLCSASLSPSCV